MAAQIRLIETWKALNTKTSLSHLFKKLDSSTRAIAHNKTKTTPHSHIKESSFVYPNICLWNKAPISVADATTESQARTARETFVKTLLT